jgi:hypothetical protein
MSALQRLSRMPKPEHDFMSPLKKPQAKSPGLHLASQPPTANSQWPRAMISTTALLVESVHFLSTSEHNHHGNIRFECILRIGTEVGKMWSWVMEQSICLM